MITIIWYAETAKMLIKNVQNVKKILFKVVLEVFVQSVKKDKCYKMVCASTQLKDALNMIRTLNTQLALIAKEDGT